MKKKASTLTHLKVIDPIIISESEEESVESEDLKKLGNSKGKFFHCQDPNLAAESVIKNKLSVADTVAETILSDIYKWVATASADNASVSFGDRVKLSTHDIERIVGKILDFTDNERVDFALKAKLIFPLDFSPIADESFYKGVKARPGHVSPGLIFDDEERLSNYQETLCSRHIVLTSGPSGAGKSSAMWACVYQLTSRFRWFELAHKATIADIDRILNFILSRNPSPKSPIAIVMDEVSGENIQLWNFLAIEVTKQNHLFLLGSIRSEDTYLIEQKASIGIFNRSLTEGIAQNVWNQLRGLRQTAWEHWREPFEISRGLMLEYVHVLTQGQRLTDVIKEQVEMRVKVERYDELAILRLTSAASAFGGEIDTDNLRKATSFSHEALSRSLKRLLDEHLVFETKPGVLGGLHQLRSLALFEATHDQIVYQADDSIWNCLQTLTYDSLATFILRMFVEHKGHDQAQLLEKLALAIENNKVPRFWEGVFNGLGFYSCELMASDFIAVLQKHKVRKSVWLPVSMFAIAGVQPPEISTSEHWKVVGLALDEFKALQHVDYRKLCLEHLSNADTLPNLEGIIEAIDFLSSLGFYPVFTDGLIKS